MSVEATENLIVGGGIIGLSIAYELAKRGRTVSVIEKDKFGEKASWAGAGIITPANAATAVHPLEHLEALSHDAHDSWSAELKQITGIDNGFRRCGGLYLARTNGESAAMVGAMADWKAREIGFQELAPNQRPKPFQSIQKCVHVPGESQFSNPHHLQALIAACQKLGVTLHQDVGETKIEFGSGRIEWVASTTNRFQAQQYFLACGPWTQKLVDPMQIPLPMQPVRGQIALYKLDPNTNSPLAGGPIISEGSRYLVPRVDGHIIAGATIEEVGFDCRTSDNEIADLRAWAESITDELNDETFVKSWAGLRPGTYDGFPYLGRLSCLDSMQNVFVATGHFKSGLHLSTGTAIVMADLLEGKNPTVDLRPFCPSRAADHQSMESK